MNAARHPPASETIPQSPPEQTAQAPPNEAPARPGRDARGRFTAGNRGGPGNPFARQVARLRAALVRRVTEEDMEQIAEDLVVQAKTGNLAATKLLFLYVLGKPAETVDPDTLDIQEWEQVYRPLPQIMQELPAALQTLPARTACDMVETAQPFVGDALGATLRRPQEALEKMANEMANGAKEATIEQEAAGSDNTPKEEENDQPPPSANGGNGEAREAARPSANGGDGRTARGGERLDRDGARPRGRPAPSRNGGYGEDQDTARRRSDPPPRPRA